MIDRRAGAGGSGERRSTRRFVLDRRRGIRSAGAGVALAVSLTASAAPPASVNGLVPHSVASAFDVHIDAAAAQHGVSRELVRAVIEAESGFDHRAISTAGATGLMQLMPATARRFGVTDSLDARQNIFGGTRYLRVLLDTYRGDVSLSAAAYNAGEGAVARYKGIPPYRTTRAYVRRVNALLKARTLSVPVEIKAPKVEILGPPRTKPGPCSPLTLLARRCFALPPSVRLVETTSRIAPAVPREVSLHWPKPLARGLLTNQVR